MNPYTYSGLLGKGLSLTKSINWSALLDGTQKTLGVINQAIPVYYQVKPILGNAKTLFKIANVMNEPTPSSSVSNNQINTVTQTSSVNNSPIFYI